MSLWGRNDNKGSGGTVSLDYSTLVVTGSGTTFGQVGAAATGDVIRFGIKGSGGTYFGDAVIVGIASTTQCTIGSTGALTGAAIAGTSFYVSELPKYTVHDTVYQRRTGSTADGTVYGIGTNAYSSVATAFRTSGEGWVGVTTYNDSAGNLRVKSEVLVAMSGITTGVDSLHYPTNRT